MKEVLCKVKLDSYSIVFRNAMSHDNKFGSGPIDNFERTKLENLDQAIAEIERLRKDGEKLQGELSGKLLFVSIANLTFHCSWNISKNFPLIIKLFFLYIKYLKFSKNKANFPKYFS